MITQYSESYGTIPADVQTLIANRCSALDHYVLMQTGERAYTGLIYDPVTKACTSVEVARSSNYSTYTVDVNENATFEYSVSNEYYTYSNQGFGRALTLPCWEGMQTFAMTFICVVLAFAIMFKGVLFRCLRKR